MELQILRKEIDQIDEEIVHLLEQRCRTALKIGAIKAASDVPVTDLDRENMVIENIARWSCEEFAISHLKEIYRTVLRQSRVLQSNAKGHQDVK